MPILADAVVLVAGATHLLQPSNTQRKTGAFWGLLVLATESPAANRVLHQGQQCVKRTGLQPFSSLTVVVDLPSLFNLLMEVGAKGFHCPQNTHANFGRTACCCTLHIEGALQRTASVPPSGQNIL